MEQNAKNWLLEHFQEKGWPLELGRLFQRDDLGSGRWRTTIDYSCPDGTELKGVGESLGKSQADIAACEQVRDTTNFQPIHRQEVMADAQPGDALIKLAAYLSISDPANRSRWLQHNESNSALAKVFDRLEREKDGDVVACGDGRSEKYKASVVEAVVWRRFHERVLNEESKKALKEIFEFVETDQTARALSLRPPRKPNFNW